MLERLGDVLLQGTMSAATRRTLLAKALPEEGGTVDVAKLTALVLGSPEFQRRVGWDQRVRLNEIRRPTRETND